MGIESRLNNVIWINTMSIGQNIKRLRKDKGWTQGDLAKKAGISLGHVSKIERDDTEIKAGQIYKLMDSLGCSANAILGNSNEIRSALMMSYERAEGLPEEDIKTIIDLIDKYCTANAMKAMLDGNRSFYRMAGEHKWAKDEIQ